MNERVGRISREGVVLLVAFIALAAGACRSNSSGIGMSNRSTAASTTAPPSPLTPSPSATPASQVEGVWQTAHLSEKDIVAAYKAAGGTQEGGRALFAQLGGGATKFAVLTLKFFGGTLAEFESANGNPAQQGYFATYELVGSTELRITDDPRDSSCVFTLRYTRQGSSLELHYEGDNHHCGRTASEPTDPAGPTIFGSFPFTLAG